MNLQNVHLHVSGTWVVELSYIILEEIIYLQNFSR